MNSKENIFRYLEYYSIYSHSIQILDASHHTHSHLSAIGRCFWARIQGRSETLAYFLHASFQLIALEKNDEYRLKYLVPLNSIIIKLVMHIIDRIGLNLHCNHSPSKDPPEVSQSQPDAERHFHGTHATACVRMQGCALSG